MNDKKLYLIITNRPVCKECRQAVKPDISTDKIINRYHAHLMIVNGSEGFGNILPGYHFESVEQAKEWAEYVAKELGRPITETEIK